MGTPENDTDPLCACGHAQSEHGTPGTDSIGHGKCYWCGKPGNGIYPCVVFTDGAKFAAAHGKHVRHFLGEFF